MKDLLESLVAIGAVIGGMLVIGALIYVLFRGATTVRKDVQRWCNPNCQCPGITYNVDRETGWKYIPEEK